MILEGNHGFVQFQGPFIPNEEESFVVIFAGDNNRYLKRLHIQYLEGTYNKEDGGEYENLGKVKIELLQKNVNNTITNFLFGKKDNILLEDVEIINLTISAINNDLKNISKSILIDAILEEEGGGN